MWYELYLRREAALDVQEIRDALPGDAAVSESGHGLQISHSAGSFEISYYVPRSSEEEEHIRGVDLLVPGGANPALARAAFEAGFCLAESCGLSVYDPQLGRAVTRRDLESIEVRMARVASYLTETVGLEDADDLRHIAVDSPRPRLSLRTKFYLILAGTLALLAFFASYC
ncbi:MAG: hypothetical protein RBU30_00395 [Polyangia bacterium]|jgi:hypothetical protein|nr:hypothetical protein [Polyangia bacterium]